MPAKKAAKKKVVKKAAKTKKTSVKQVVPVVDVSTQENVKEVTPKLSPLTLPKLKVNPKVLAMAATLIGVGLLTYKLGPWLVPAVVDKTPITRWSLYSKLEKSYGAQVLEDMINEAVLNRAIAKSGVQVDQGKVDTELQKIEKQFESLGGLDEALKTRGMTKDNLVSQIKTQLAVEEILKDKIMPTDEEVTKYFEDNKETLYKDKKLDELKEEISTTLKQTKLRDEFMTWFEGVKKDINIKNFSSENSL